jgi:hypothetical protein
MENQDEKRQDGRFSLWSLIASGVMAAVGVISLLMAHK